MKKRPRGRAPNGSNGVPARWDTAVGWCDDLSADGTPPAQEHVDADANLAGVNVEFVKALTAERDQANQKVLNLQQEIKSLQEAVEREKLKAAEDTKKLQLMAIARRPDMGTSTLCVHPSSRPTWWKCVEDHEFTVLNECFQESLIGHRKNTTICAAPQIKVERTEQRFNPAEAAEYNQYLLTKMPFHVAVEFVCYPWQRIQPVGDHHNEIFAWHGTTNQHSLEQDGFDMRHIRYGKAHANLFGDGLYFSPHASKADMYSRPMPLSHKTAPKQIYLVRLNMGRVWEIYVSEKNRRFPPNNRDTARAVGAPTGSGHATLNDE